VAVELILLSRVAFRDHEISGPRLRGLVALLAADVRAGASTARLVDGLWPDEQPENPTKALQVLVSRIRAQLGAGVVASTPTGYRLALGDEQVDAAAVLVSAGAAARHARAGDHAAALADAEAGLALWAAPPVDEAALDDPVARLRAERAPAYHSLVRARALALSRLGRHAEAVDALAELAAEHPRDEEILLELLRCEAATAGPSAALIRYDAYRRALRDELGTDPGAALQAVHRELLQGERPAVRHGVVHEPNPLLGRADDIAAVAGLLRSSRVTSIVGAGGLGKTRLAHVVSRQAEQRVVHFVGLAGVTTDDDVAGEVASALGVGDPKRASGGHLGPIDVLTAILHVLGHGRTLLVLDNCEQVIGGVADLVQAIVSMTENVRVLTTSRAPLGLSSESVYLLPELSLPTTVELFEQRACAARPGVELPADVVEELCRKLDGLPLAVELAAARVRVMSVDEIARRLDDRFALLRGGARDAPERHRTLHAVVDWSWNLLEPSGQAAMRALSVFPGGFTADAAEHMLGDDTLSVLEHLVDQSLLKVADTPAGVRFRMLETVREFSTAERAVAGETEDVRARFLAWARAFGSAHHEAPFGPDPYPSAARIRAEQDNLVLALRHGLDGCDGATVAATFAVLASLWTAETNNARVATLADEVAWVLSHFRPEPRLVDVTRASSVLCAVNAFALGGPRAVRSLVTLRKLPPAPPTTLLRATAIVMATPSVLASDHAALDVLCESDEPLLAGVANGFATYIWESEADLGRALKAGERMLESFGRGTTPWLLVLAHSRLGELCLHVEQGEEALRHTEETLRALEEWGSLVDAAQFQWAMALTNAQIGDVVEAERCVERATQGEPDDDIGTVTFGLGVRAEIRLARGDTDGGLALWRRAVGRLQDPDSPYFGTDVPGLAAWSAEVRSVAVVAHARHGRLDLVEDVVDALPLMLSAMLTDPVRTPPTYLMGFPACGTVLLALAVTDIERGRRTSGARMIALAERMHFLRSFQPTMSSARAREAAERADRAAYADAVSAYADLGRDELRGAALDALRAREERE
jgi:predicted ATPase/DNA-binding SARP family transcriptional activator